eukprot:m.233958 g.233958  ORF g.233958 m.233958 type:complete len:86 (-) comp16030_c0_seq23:236-493(-)
MIECLRSVVVAHQAMIKTLFDVHPLSVNTNNQPNFIIVCLNYKLPGSEVGEIIFQHELCISRGIVQDMIVVVKRRRDSVKVDKIY